MGASVLVGIGFVGCVGGRFWVGGLAVLGWGGDGCLSVRAGWGAEFLSVQELRCGSGAGWGRGFGGLLGGWGSVGRVFRVMNLW